LLDLVPRLLDLVPRLLDLVPRLKTLLIACYKVNVLAQEKVP